MTTTETEATSEADTTPNAETELRFEVGAGVIFTLGRDLITDASQAIMELVKNSYDADSGWANVTIDSRPTSTSEHSPGAVGFVRIEDAGLGMTLQQIREGWLTIARSEKRTMKAEGKKTARNRTPLGDKGLGRLGAQALGRYVEIVTRPAGTNERISVWIDWDRFSNTTLLSHIKLPHKIEDRGTQGQGTTITILGLHWGDGWASEDSQRELQQQLSSLISPFAAIRGFTVAIEVNDRSLDLMAVAARLRRMASTRYKFEFVGNTLTVSGVARLQYCKPSPASRADRDVADRRFAAYVGNDAGGKLFHYLDQQTKSGRNKGLELRRSDEPDWFISGHISRALDELDGRTYLKDVVPSPGPFTGELDNFVLAPRGASDEAFGITGDVRKTLHDLHGIRVYRDGFGIKLHEDWLGLAKHITGGSSFFELKLENTMGYVALTSAGNPQLQETADRQRFNEDLPAYRNFRLLLTEVVRFVGSFQELIRRGTADFLRAESSASAETASASDSDIVQKLDAVSKGAVAAVRSAKESRKELSAHKQIISTAKAARTNRNAADRDVLTALESSSQLVQSQIDTISRLGTDMMQVEELRTILTERLEAVQEQVTLLHETAALGLAAEVLSHEVAQIATGLSERSTTVLRKMRTDGLASYAIAYAEHVKGQTNALRKQLAHLTPAMRYVRDNREEIEVKTLIAELVEYHRDRLEKEHIAISVTPASKSFRVVMNRGKLIQVIDNLLLNSEYWVLDELKRTRSKGSITLEYASPHVRVQDTGPGVDQSIEDAIFEPFITRKAAGKGRGLGLFVSKRLLESEGCTIRLMDERNGRSRRHTFEIDLSGAISAKR